VTESRFSAPRAAPSPTGRKANDKRDRILLAATRVFARKGFHATRVSEVAKAAGVADGTIYLYFKSKDELLISIFEDRVDHLLEAVRREMDALPNAQARLRRIIELQLGLLDGERDLAEVITVSLRQSTRLLKQYAAPKFLAYLETIAEVIAGGQAEGVFREDVAPLDAARAVFGALDGLALTWALGPAHPGALQATAGQIANIFLQGLERR